MWKGSAVPEAMVFTKLCGCRLQNYRRRECGSLKQPHPPAGYSGGTHLQAPLLLRAQYCSARSTFPWRARASIASRSFCVRTLRPRRRVQSGRPRRFQLQWLRIQPLSSRQHLQSIAVSQRAGSLPQSSLFSVFTLGHEYEPVARVVRSQWRARATQLQAHPARIGAPCCGMCSAALRDPPT